MSKVHVVWQHGGIYEPAYIVAAFSTPALADAYVKLHDGGNEDHYYTGELEVDEAGDLGLITRGTRPWSCWYYFYYRDEWDPEKELSIAPVNPNDVEKLDVDTFIDERNCPIEVWDLTVFAPTAVEARQIAVERIEQAKAEGKGWTDRSMS